MLYLFCGRPWIASCLTSQALIASFLSQQFLSQPRPRVLTQSMLHPGVPMLMLRRHEPTNAKSKWSPLLPPLRQGRSWARKPRVSKSMNLHQKCLQPRLPQTVHGVYSLCVDGPGNALTCINSICIVITLQFVQGIIGHRA
jgi:hypothetical protein